MVFEERRSVKLPTYTSIFFRLPAYDKQTFCELVQSQDCSYDKSSMEFEFPTNRLCYLVDNLIKFGDIEIKFYEKKETQIIRCNDYNYKVKPFAHQISGVEYGVSHSNGWLLLDDAGLGKSFQAVYIAEILKEREGLEHCLIICGVNSLKYNWLEEIKKFSNLSATILGMKYNRKGNIDFETVEKRCEILKEKIDEFFVITNIETLQSEKFAESFKKSKNKFDLIILDEAHKVKEPSNKSTKTLLKLKAKRCIAMTGTLLMNSPENAYVPLKWTGNTSSNYSQFKHEYNVYGGFGGLQVIDHKNLELLQELIDSCSLRRLKSEVLDLPPKVYKKEFVELTKEQRELYNSVESGIIDELDKLDHKPTIMEEITINMRLRQITATPSMLSTENIKSAKMIRMKELVEDYIANGEKVVIFCTFKGTANESFELLKDYNPIICTGDTSETDSSKAIFDFQNCEDRKVFIGTWQKCGTGFTLTSASRMIFIDTPWTDASFQQAADRIYRIGQKNTVFITTIIAKDTYDERVQEILDTKKELSDIVIDYKYYKKKKGK